MGRFGRHPEPHALVRWLATSIVLAALLAGCGEERAQRLTVWTLSVPDEQPREVELPAHLNELLPERTVRYRLSSEVVLEPWLREQEVELALLHLPAVLRVFVDGREARLVSRTGASSKYGGSMPRRWLLPAGSIEGHGPLTITLEVDHAWTHSAWWDAAPELLPAGAPSALEERNRLLNEQGGWLGLIALSQVGLTFLVVYFWDRRLRAYLWFAIQGLTAAYYPAYVLGVPALALSWPIQNILLAQSLAVAPIISVYFSHAFFELGRPHPVWRLLLAIALISPLTVAMRDWDFHDLSYAAPIVVACVLSAVIYQLVTGVRLLRSDTDRRTVVFFLLCWIALGGSSWVDLLAWTGTDLLAGGRPACAGLGMFAVFQSLLLGRSHFRSLAQADQLNEQLRKQVKSLEERQVEVDLLNDELRRQIGRRTQELLANLTNNTDNAPADIGPGRLIDGRYRVLSVLGRGGMGTVFRVERLSDDKHLAAKISQEVRGLALARLAREAQIAARIAHPNVVSIVDADVAQEGYAFLVMELVEGRSLAECESHRPLRWCLEVLRQTLEGVKALHEHGIVHRDLKPSNILIAEHASASPRVKITDFGISRWLARSPDEEAAQATPNVTEPTVQQRVPGSDGARRVARADQGAASASVDAGSSPQLTRTGVISGTPLYVAPELAERGAQVAPAVDVFSVGVVAYRLLCNRQPHLEAPLLARLSGREIVSALPVATFCPELSPQLARAVDACLSADPLARPAVSDLLALIEEQLAVCPREDAG